MAVAERYKFLVSSKKKTKKTEQKNFERVCPYVQGPNSKRKRDNLSKAHNRRAAETENISNPHPAEPIFNLCLSAWAVHILCCVPLRPWRNDVALLFSKCMLTVAENTCIAPDSTQQCPEFFLGPDNEASSLASSLWWCRTESVFSIVGLVVPDRHIETMTGPHTETVTVPTLVQR